MAMSSEALLLIILDIVHIDIPYVSLVWPAHFSMCLSKYWIYVMKVGKTYLWGIFIIIYKNICYLEQYFSLKNPTVADLGSLTFTKTSLATQYHWGTKSWY